MTSCMVPESSSLSLLGREVIQLSLSSARVALFVYSCMDSPSAHNDRCVQWGACGDGRDWVLFSLRGRMTYVPACAPKTARFEFRSRILVNWQSSSVGSVVDLHQLVAVPDKSHSAFYSVYLTMMRHLSLLFVSTMTASRGAHSFSLGLPLRCRTCANQSHSATVVTHAETSKQPPISRNKFEYSKLIGSAFLIGSLAFGGMPVLADEIGVEKEAPTVFTGESVMVRAKHEIPISL